VSGLRLSAAFAPAARGPYAGLGYTIVPSAHAATDAIEIHVGRMPFEAFAGFRVPAGRIALAAEVALVFERATRRTTSLVPGAAVLRPDTTWLLGLSPRLRASLPVSRALELYAAAGFDGFVNDVRYVADVAGEPQTLLEPYALRPRGELGVTLRAF